MSGEIPRIHRHSDRPRFDRPYLRVRDHPDRREIGIDVYPWPPWVAAVVVLMGYAWGLVPIVVGLLLAVPEFFLYRRLRRIRITCRGDSICVVRGFGPIVQAREIQVVGLSGFFFFRPKTKGQRDPKWGELKRTRLQVAAVSESGAGVVLAPNLPNERMARAVVEELAAYTGLGAAGKEPPAAARS